MSTKRISWGRLFAGCVLCGGVLFAIGAAFYFVTPVLMPRLAQTYDNDALFRPWQGGTRTYMLMHPWLYGVVFTLAFLAWRKAVVEVQFAGIRGGLLFGSILFVVGSLPIFALNLASFQVPLEVVLTWSVQNLCQYAGAGAALGCFFRSRLGYS